MKLLAGELTKSCTVSGLKLSVRPPTDDEKQLGFTSCMWRYGQVGSGEWRPVDTSVIAEWKNNGEYHELFSTSPNVVVPEHVHSEAALKMSVATYKKITIDAMFEPAVPGDTYRAPKVRL